MFKRKNKSYDDLGVDTKPVEIFEENEEVAKPSKQKKVKVKKEKKQRNYDFELLLKDRKKTDS